MADYFYRYNGFDCVDSVVIHSKPGQEPKVMAYREFKCLHCLRSSFAFDNETYKVRCSNAKCFNVIDYYDDNWEKMPPNPTVIHTTECFMSEAVLDSMDTAMELDRVLTREKQHDRELKESEMGRRNI